MEKRPTMEDFYRTQKGVFVTRNDGTYFQEFRRRYFYPEPLVDLVPNGSSVIYTHVTEYNGTKEEHRGKTAYEFSYSANDYVSTRSVGSIENINGADFQVDNGKYISPLKGWNNGKLKTKTVRDKLGRRIKKIENTYEEINNLYRLGLKIERFTFFQYLSSGCPFFSNEIENMDHTAPLIDYGLENNFHYNDYYIDAGIKRIKATTETRYDPDFPTSLSKTLTNTTTYNYNDEGLVNKKTVYDSEKEIETYYFYPSDYVIPSQPIENYCDGLFSLIQKNAINIPIETIKLVNNKIVDGSLRLYKNQDVDNVFLYKLLKISTSSPIDQTVDNFKSGIGQSGGSFFYYEDTYYDTETVFDSYDTQGNILQYHKKNDINTSFYWGYDVNIQ